MPETSGWKAKLASVVAAFALGGAVLEAVVDFFHENGNARASAPTTPPTPEHKLQSESTPTTVSVPLHPGWTLPRPDKLPASTYNPVIFALGIVLLALGIVSSYYVGIVGAILFVVGLGKWIGELKDEH